MERTIDRFDDIFHRHGDDNDDNEEDINIIHKNPISIFDSDNETMENDFNIFTDPPDNLALVEQQKDIEEHLSQKLSQLSASTKDLEEDNIQVSTSTTKKRPSFTPPSPTTTAVVELTTTKKLKTEDNQIETIPKYLTSNYKAFDENLINFIRISPTFVNIEDLRNIAFRIHQIECVKLDRILWTIYLQSGTGELKIKRPIMSIDSNLKVFLWPEEVKRKMIEHGHTQMTNPQDIDDQTCIDYVKRVLEKFQNQLLHYQKKLEEEKRKLDYTLTNEIQDTLLKFVQQYGISVYKIPIDGLISTVEFDYKDRLIQLAFENENPNEFQKELFKNIFKVKSQKEISKFEVAILKQRLSHNHLPKEFHSLEIPSLLLLNTIQDRNIRQRLEDRTEKILQRTRSDMMLVYIELAEAKMNEYRLQYDKFMSDMKMNQRSGPVNQTLNETMLNLMEERFKNINEHLICLYRLKIHFFDNAPTVMN